MISDTGECRYCGMCFICPNIVSRVAALNLHYEVQHPRYSRWEPNSLRIWKTLKRNSRDTRWCHICDAQLQRPDFETHLKLHNFDRKDISKLKFQFVCSLCGEIAGYGADFSAIPAFDVGMHLRERHHWHFCIDCDRFFPSNLGRLVGACKVRVVVPPPGSA